MEIGDDSIADAISRRWAHRPSTRAPWRVVSEADALADAEFAHASGAASGAPDLQRATKA